jgi:hypothetical protein
LNGLERETSPGRFSLPGVVSAPAVVLLSTPRLSKTGRAIVIRKNGAHDQPPCGKAAGFSVDVQLFQFCLLFSKNPKDR